MAIMTPRGLKVRLDLPHAFGLMARIWSRSPRANAFAVLKTCEAIELIPSFLGFVLGIVFVLNPIAPQWAVLIAISCGNLVGLLTTQFGPIVLLRRTGLVAAGKAWSWLTGYGVLLVLGVTTSWLARGVPGAAWWLGSIVAALLLRLAADALLTVFLTAANRRPWTPTEINFFIAYSLHAVPLGITCDVDVSDEEVQSDEWRYCLRDYAALYPAAVKRFPDQAELLGALRATA